MRQIWRVGLKYQGADGADPGTDPVLYYYESMNMEDLRGGIRNDVEQAIAITSGILLVILVGAFAVSRKIVTGITEPIGELCDAAVAAGGGDFRIRGGENRTGRD